MSALAAASSRPASASSAVTSRPAAAMNASVEAGSDRVVAAPDGEADGRPITTAAIAPGARTAGQPTSLARATADPTRPLRRRGVGKERSDRPRLTAHRRRPVGPQTASPVPRQPSLPDGWIADVVSSSPTSTEVSAGLAATSQNGKVERAPVAGGSDPGADRRVESNGCQRGTLIVVEPTNGCPSRPGFGGFAKFAPPGPTFVRYSTLIVSRCAQPDEPSDCWTIR